jgi:hypothetical protein
MIKQDLVLKVDQDNEKIVKERSKLQEMWTNKLIVQGLEDNLHTMCDLYVGCLPTYNVRSANFLYISFQRSLLF